MLLHLLYIVSVGDDGKIDYTRADREPGASGADVDPSDIDLIESLATTLFGGIDVIDQLTCKPKIIVVR